MERPGEDQWEESDGDMPFIPPELHEVWRGEQHLEHWPEQLAGPEYWLYKADEEDEKGK